MLHEASLVLSLACGGNHRVDDLTLDFKGPARNESPRNPEKRTSLETFPGFKEATL